MKSLKIFLAALAAIMLSGCSILSSGLSKEPDPSAQELVIAALDEEMLKFEVDYIIPDRGASRSSNYGYFLTIKDGKVSSYLPFFGVSYQSSPYGTEPSGIEFDNCPVNIDKSLSRPEKGKYVWRFVALSGRERVDVTLTFFDNGSASLSCHPANRSNMNYNGDLVSIPETE